MSNEINEYRYIDCLIDMLKNENATDIKQSSDNLSVFLGTKDMVSSFSPKIIQYTHGIGGFASEVSMNDIKTAVLFDSLEAVDFAKEHYSDKKANNLSIIEDSLPIENYAFPMSPDGEGWSCVILDDIVPYIGDDIEMVKLFNAIHLTTCENAKLIVRLPKIKESSWNREYNKVVITESIKKENIRKFTRTITSHGDLELRHSEKIYNFSDGDIHDNAREASFRPTRDIGLNSAVWCCYDRV